MRSAIRLCAGLATTAVVAAVFLHGLNGIRIILTSFGVGVTRQKQLFYAFMILAVLIILVFTVRMY